MSTSPLSVSMNSSLIEIDCVASTESHYAGLGFVVVVTPDAMLLLAAIASRACRRRHSQLECLFLKFIVVIYKTFVTVGHVCGSDFVMFT